VFKLFLDKSLVVSPLDVYATAEAMHQALTMPAEERRQRSERMRSMIEREDIIDWLCQQLRTIIKLNL
jgi:trehalose-6-phosphate synthase